nr:endonuclease/exonuclease/phosphatase family protein [Pacificibacter maritimus]
MRIATYNVEWFDALFDDAGKPLLENTASRRHKVTCFEQLTALSHVFKSLDADAIMVIEAPDTSRKRDTVQALEQFADFAGLRANTVVTGMTNDTRQEIALLYDPLILRARHDPKGAMMDQGQLVTDAAISPRFDQEFLPMQAVDLQKPVRFSKPPLEVQVQVRDTGVSFRMIGVHVKSKAPHGARDHEDFVRISIENRRKQAAQCLWLRARVDEHLSANDPLIVLGDFNDGPGLDAYEKLFGRSGLEIVIGDSQTAQKDAQARCLFDPHAKMAMAHRPRATPTTSRFFISHENRYLSALLDYVMLSSDLKPHGTWRIWHPFDDPFCYHDTALREALLTASDHFPVTVDLELPS